MIISRASLPSFSAGCEVYVQDEGDLLQYISRWSKTQVTSAAAVIVPATEDDVRLTILYAAEHGVKIIPASGGHGSFVPITDQCIYLDMRKLDGIALDEDAGIVTLGGGVVTEAVLATLSAQGHFTCIPNSNAVGIVGFCLGGGSSPYNGLKGLAIDNIVSIQIITSSGETHTLSPDSPGAEADLFNVLCGAGFGFGVVTSITLRAWPISELGMTEVDQIWTRRLVFAPSAIQTAAELFAKLQTPERRMNATLLFARAPPTAPAPGSPMVMLIVHYLGAASDAEKAAAAALDAQYTTKALTAETSYTPIGAMNNMAGPLNRHGDYKENYATWVPAVSPATIVAAFESFIQFGDSTREAKGTSYVIMAAKSTEGMLEHDVEGRKSFPRMLRDRKVFVQVVPWWTAPVAETKARQWAAGMLALVNPPQRGKAAEGKDVGGETHVSAFAANMNKGIDLTAVWPKDKIVEIRRLKALWDHRNMFWNPVVDGV